MRFGRAYHPYVIKLEQRLKENHFQPTIDEKGQSGYRYAELFPLLGERLKSHAYDIVAILVGTNDIGITNEDDEFLYSTDQVIRNIETMYEMVFSSSDQVKLVAMTIPLLRQRRNHGPGPLDKRRTIINEWIRKYAVENMNRIYLLDVEKFMDPSDGKLWDDNIHFSEIGYDKLGEEMCQLLLSKHSTTDKDSI